MKKDTRFFSSLTILGLLLFGLIFSFKGLAQTQYTMSIASVTSTANTMDVTLTVTATNPSPGVRFGGFQAGINFSTAIINGGTISATYVEGSRSAELFDLPLNVIGTATVGHIRLATAALSGAQGVDMLQGTSLTLGTYRISNTVNWTTSSNANLWLQNVQASGKTNSLVLGYPYGQTTPAFSYTTTVPASPPGLILSHTSTSTLSVFLNLVQMDMEWLGSTESTADFQIRLTNPGSTPITLNGLIIRGVHAVYLTSGVITWKALNDNTLPGWLNWPNTGTNNLPYISSQRKLNFSSSNGIFSSETAPAIPSGSGVVVGTFRIYTTTSWTPDSDFGFVWEMTSGGVVAYVNGATTVTNIQAFGTVSSATTCASCLIVTASSAQPLNVGGIVPPITASVLSVSSANDTICPGASTNLTTVVTGGNPPYTVTVTDGTTNYSATSASPVSIPVSPTTTSTYTIVSVSSGSVVGSNNSGSPTVTVPVPTFSQVAAACIGAVIDPLPTSSTNNITGTWTPEINNTTTTTYTFTPQVGQCATTSTMTISINSPIVPTFDIPDTPICSGSTLSNTSTNGISGTWSPASINALTTTYTFTPSTGQCATSAPITLTGTQSDISTTTISACDTYTWENNGQAYTTSGSYTGTVVNCITPTLNLTISPSLTDSTNITSCGPYTYNGQIFTESGIYIGETTNCVTPLMIISINSPIVPTFDTPDTPICSGSTLSNTSTNGISGTWSPASINASTTTYTFTPSTGQCATSAPITLTGTQSDSSTTPISACDTYTWENNGQTYTTSGSYTGTVVNCNTATLNLTITPLTTNGSVTTSICAGDSYTWPANGQTYSSAQSGLTEVTGCNTATLNLTITSATTTTGSVDTSICAGDSYTWPANGQTYSSAQSGVTVVSDCNTATLNLTITPYSESTIGVSACGMYEWNGQTYTTSGIYTNTNSDCLTETLDLTITPSSTNTTTIVSPGNYTWNNTGVTYTSSGFYMGSTVNCVTEYLDLTINSSGISEEEMLLFSLYPNPVSEFLTINFNGESNEEYSIIDNFGSVVKRGVLENMSTEISVSELSAGLYYFKIEGTKPRKFSKIN